eukprot:4077490-Heterocapsa_arctica.AAC.1
MPHTIWSPIDTGPGPTSGTATWRLEGRLAATRYHAEPEWQVQPIPVPGSSTEAPPQSARRRSPATCGGCRA